MYHILFVDDDQELQDAAKLYFSAYDYHIQFAFDAKSALHFAKGTTYQCIILDLKLPDHDGFDVLKYIRKYTNIPIIVLSNYTEFEKRVEGLSLGADDYICKPFSFDELRLRIELRIKSHFEDRDPKVLNFGKLKIDSGSLSVSYQNKRISLSSIEMDILIFLVSKPGRVFSYEQIYDAVWNQPMNSGKHTLQARVSEVRIQLNSLCDTHNFIDTVRGKGYRFIKE